MVNITENLQTKNKDAFLQDVQGRKEKRLSDYLWVMRL
jgi:hypothetical protein